MENGRIKQIMDLLEFNLNKIESKFLGEVKLNFNRIKSKQFKVYIFIGKIKSRNIF